MPFQIGRRIKGDYVRLPESFLDVTIPGWVYEIQALADRPVPNPEEFANLIVEKFAEKFPDVKIYYIYIDGEEVRIQLSASPVAWSDILGFLPLIFALVGLALVAVAVWGVLQTIPSWAWACLIGGILILWLLPTLTGLIPAPKEEGAK